MAVDAPVRPATRPAGRPPAWTIAAPLAGIAMIAVPVGAGGPLAALVGLVLALAVMAAVHHAETVAHRVGEPYGAMILAIAVTIIEVALILTLMLGESGAGPGAPTAALPRDTIMAAMMITMNGMVGLCLMTGATRHHEQRFTRTGVSATLAMIATLATLTLVLPNYTTTLPGPVYDDRQLAFVAVASLALYGVFLFAQSLRHRDYFLLDPGAAPGDLVAPCEAEPAHGGSLRWSLVLLMVALVAVVWLAKSLSGIITAGVVAAGLPLASVGVVIAALVLLPEGLAALAAARADRVQRSLNLALGSALASIGLTIPAIAAAALLFDLPLTLGLDAKGIVLLALTLLVATLSLGTGRTTILQGAVHLVIFAAFLFTVVVP